MFECMLRSLRFLQICQDSCFEIFFEQTLRSLHLLPLLQVMRNHWDVFVFIRSLQMHSMKTLLKCADVWWCIVRGNGVGTQEVLVYFMQRNFDMGMQSCTNKAWQPLTDFRGPGRRWGKGEVNRQTRPPTNHCSQEAKPADPLQGSDPSIHSSDRDERGPTCPGSHR